MPKTVLGVKLQTPLVGSQQWHPHQPACQGCYGQRVPSIPLARAPSASPPGSPTQGAGAGAGTPLRQLWASWCGVRAAVRSPAPAQMREDRGCRSGQGSTSSEGTWEACWALLNGHLRRVRTSPLPAPDPGAPTLRPGCRPQGRLISSALGQPGSISIVQPQADPPQQGTRAPPSPAPLQLGGQGLGAALRSHRRVILFLQSLRTLVCSHPRIHSYVPKGGGQVLWGRQSAESSLAKMAGPSTLRPGCTPSKGKRPASVPPDKGEEVKA